jgi:hypothetical protein
VPDDSRPGQPADISSAALLTLSNPFLTNPFLTNPFLTGSTLHSMETVASPAPWCTPAIYYVP